MKKHAFNIGYRFFNSVYFQEFNYTILRAGHKIQVNISISNMGNLEYPAYVEVDRRSRSYFLYK